MSEEGYSKVKEYIKKGKTAAFIESLKLGSSLRSKAKEDKLGNYENNESLYYCYYS